MVHGPDCLADCMMAREWRCRGGDGLVALSVTHTLLYTTRLAVPDTITTDSATDSTDQRAERRSSAAPPLLLLL